MTNKLLLLILFTLSTSMASAQIKGLTETGDEVLLYNDGSWKYADESLNEFTEIEINETHFTKGEQSTFLVKSTKTSVGIWIDPKQWTFSKAEDSSPAEFTFKMKELGIYGMLISEKLELANESLIDIAINNAKEAAQNVNVIHKEYRKVNGIDLIMMQLSGTIQGVNFVYFGYYYSGPEGAFQVLTYTSKKEFVESKDIMEKFLNGFVRI